MLFATNRSRGLDICNNISVTYLSIFEESKKEKRKRERERERETNREKEKKTALTLTLLHNGQVPLCLAIYI